MTKTLLGTTCGKSSQWLGQRIQVWATSGMLILCVSFALFFMEFPKKISSKGAATVIRTCGVGAMIFSFLAVTPYHDKMITIASPLAKNSVRYPRAYKHVLHNCVRIQVKIALPKTAFDGLPACFLQL
jgi:hypothetical protein